MTPFDRLVDRVAVTDEDEVVPMTERQVRGMNLGVTVATHERDEHAGRKRIVEFPDRLPDERLGPYLDHLDIPGSSSRPSSSRVYSLISSARSRGRP